MLYNKKLCLRSNKATFKTNFCISLRRLFEKERPTDRQKSLLYLFIYKLPTPFYLRKIPIKLSLILLICYIIFLIISTL